MVKVFARKSGRADQAQVTPADIAAALEAVQQAEARFNQVTEKDLVDAATLELTAARIRLSYLFRLARMERGIT
jgi:hypothetical protein